MQVSADECMPTCRSSSAVEVNQKPKAESVAQGERALGTDNVALQDVPGVNTMPDNVLYGGHDIAQTAG